MREVIILRGPSGVGKSTWVKENCGKEVIVCSADHFWLKSTGITDCLHLFERGGYHWHNGEWHEYVFDPYKLSEAHAWCLRQFLCHIRDTMRRKNVTLVVDNTNIKTWQYEHYIQVATIAGLSVRIVEFRLETIAQLKEIAARNLHGVPVETVAKMCLDFEPDGRAEVVTIKQEA